MISEQKLSYEKDMVFGKSTILFTILRSKTPVYLNIKLLDE